MKPFPRRRSAPALREDKIFAKLFSKQHRIKNSLKLSVLDGASFAAMAGLTQNYITPFALALKATTQQVGLLASIPNLTMAFTQLAAPNLSEKAGSRKGLILPMVFAQALMWLPILLIPFFFEAGGIWWLIAFVTLSTVVGGLASPAWGSLMADLVPELMRGRYFAFRGRTMVFTTLAFSLFAGAVLQFFTNRGLAGFAILFGGALIFRLISFYFLTGMYEPQAARNTANSHSLLYMITHLGSTNLGRFTIYFALIMFAANIAGPFFSVYMLRDLNFSYATYVMITSAHAVSNIIFQSFWGRRADRAGNMMVIKVTSVLLPFVPLIWMLNKNVFYLMGAEVFSGLAWAGFNLSSINFVYDASEPENRTRQIALFNSLTGLAVFFGALIGGYLAPHLPAFLGYNMRSLMLISGIARGIIVILLLRIIMEVRQVPQMNFLRFILNRRPPVAASEAGK